MSSSRSTSLGPLFLLAVIIGVLVAGAIFLWRQDARRGAEFPLYSIHRTDGEGAAVAFRLYERSGLKPQIWDQDLTRLQSPGLMIFVAPTPKKTIAGEIEVGQEGEILPHEIEALDQWVRKGNVAVILSRQQNDLYQSIGLIADEPNGEEGTAAPTEPVQPSVLAQDVEKLQTHTQFGFKYGRKKGELAKLMDVPDIEPPIPLIPADEWMELFAKKSAERSVPQVVSAVRGKGLYVAVNDVFPAGNLGIAQGDNAEFIRNLARLVPADGTIWFDEYHKRSVERGLMSYFRDRAMMPALIYGLLLVGLVFWRTGFRLGAAEALVPDRRRDSGEYVKAVATLYQTAGMPRDALSTIYADFRRRLVGALRMDGLTDLEEVGRRYEMRTGRPAIEARGALIETEAALARGTLEEAEALQFCARLTQIDEALHHRASKGEQGRRS